MILPEGSRTKTYDLMEVLLKEKDITFNNDYTVTYQKPL